MCAGRITHHDEVSRLKKVYELVKEARQQVEGQLHFCFMSPESTGGLLHVKDARIPSSNESHVPEDPLLRTAL